MDCFLLPGPAVSATLPGFSGGIAEQAAFSVPPCLGTREEAAAAVTAELQTASQGWEPNAGQLPAPRPLDGGAELGSVGSTATAPGRAARCRWGFATSASRSCPAEHREQQALPQAGSTSGPLSCKGAAERLSCCVLWERFVPACPRLTSVPVRLLRVKN